MTASTAHDAPFSLFDDLPVELLKRLVDLVHDQDAVFNADSIGRADPTDMTGWREDSTATDVQGGRWSCWLGRGVASLSLVNRQLRVLALPKLVETTTLKQLARAQAEAEVPTVRKLLTHVRHLDLRDNSVPHHVLASPVLPLLSVNRITVNDRSVALLDPTALNSTTNPQAGESAASALQALALNVAFVEVQNLGATKLQTVLRRLNLPSLRKLTVNTSPESDLPLGDNASPFTLTETNPPHDESPLLFKEMSSLESLALADWATRIVDRAYRVSGPWVHEVHLEALKTLKFRAGFATTAQLAFIPSLAPNLETLHLADVFVSEASPPSLPSLRVFHVSTGDDVPSLKITFPKPSSIHTLIVEAKPCEATKCRDHLPSPEQLPPALRLVIFRFCTVCTPDDADSYRSDCLARGVVFRLECTPDVNGVGVALQENGYDEGASPPLWEDEAVSAAHDSLSWAARRLDHARSIGDHRTVHEIVQATMRLRERQAIEMQ
ncbi:hypothetical protein JCM6882_007777 [Rhodosporidiobolus microsporus]